ncbi:MAG: hypothetical protein H6Q17_371 [Bacteroidetes bacterium]|nr:hypothetical protein [Bacteroidota bacterium]
MNTFLDSDLELLKKKGITVETCFEQLNCFASGFPFLQIEKAAEINDGIMEVDTAHIDHYIQFWNEFLSENKKIVKFVPASGAASRMFKNLFEFLEGESETPTSIFEKKFFSEIEYFAFYEALNSVCFHNERRTIPQLIETGEYKAVVRNLLEEKGLNYQNLPKGLLFFHRYSDETRTPVQEHLAEGAAYAATHAGEVNIHFTVSNEHHRLFEQHVKEQLAILAKRNELRYHVTFSEQKTSTDTLAADADNQPFRDNGKLLFRPGGHGALIENLNDIDADVVFIKNIDNVTTDRLKKPTITYKRLLAGILVQTQKQIFGFLHELDNKEISDAKLEVIKQFCKSRLSIHHPAIDSLNKDVLIGFLRNKLHRPLRVCGMVRNEGEPGGGPYIAINPDGTASPQILESSQIDTSDPEKAELMKKATHFNPVDLVCAVKDYKGKKFDLRKYVDKNTGFISLKSKSGKELKALELPGLWNGAMSDWNTIFVDTPVETFSPVKTVNDLLRPEHQ